jgi:predicted AlkP superfamily pyrophosphatase or phosphodiesterase
MRRVLVFGIDGVRLDTLKAANTPHLDSIVEGGGLHPVWIDDATPTWSGPCWATVATGVTVQEHEVVSNEISPSRVAEYPDFLTSAREQGARTYLGVTWAPLATTKHGGPVFGHADRVMAVDGHSSGFEWADGVIADDASGALGSDDLGAAFVYFGNCDAVAHEVGTGAEYVAAIEQADARVGQVLGAVRQRSTYSDEEWTIIAVTDHGHRDGGGHGKDSDVERTAWIVASGSRLNGNPAPSRHVDVKPMVLAALAP